MPRPPRFELFESVRCLECGIVYSKPTRGGVADANPGCPQCGYVGWLSTAIPFKEESWRHRSVAGLRPLPHARSG
jgi:hypothetical protein